MKASKNKILVEYSSNNSGGYWWLKTKDWENLEKNGWVVDWNREFLYTDKGGHKKDKNGYPIFKTTTKGDDWLGASAKYAFKYFDSIKDCLEEFERITGQDVSYNGCNCCGAPHSFSWKDGYCSGEDCLKYLYTSVPKTLREACK